MTGLQLQLMKQGLQNVRCTCVAGGPPAVGQTLIGCASCNVWQHQPCCVGNSIPELTSKGYMCHPCHSEYRSEIVRKGHATRKAMRERREKEQAEATHLQVPPESGDVSDAYDGDLRPGWIRMYPQRDPQPRTAQRRRLIVTLNYGHQKSRGGRLLKQAIIDILGRRPAPQIDAEGTSLKDLKLTPRAPTSRQHDQIKIEVSREVHQGVDLDLEKKEQSMYIETKNETSALLSSPSPQELVSTKLLYDIRHKLIKNFLRFYPEASMMAEMSQILKDLENLEDQGFLTPQILGPAKIGTLLQKILLMDDIPRDKEFSFSERCRDLFEIVTLRMDLFATVTPVIDHKQGGNELNRTDSMSDKHLKSDADKPYPFNDRFNSTRLPEIRCECPPGIYQVPLNNITCVVCKNLQHKTCLRITTPNSRPRRSLVLCNSCSVLRADRAIKLFGQKLVKIATMLSDEIGTLRGYTETVLWKMYCDLPCGDQCSPTFKELTSAHFNGEYFVPMHPPPRDWVDDVVSSIRRMITNAPKEKVHYLLRDTTDPVEYNNQFTDILRELALWTYHRGPYRHEKYHLGVLAEILGLAAKGSIWIV